jgi:hypothetical protein
LHRKLWEFAFIAQALFERGMLQPGRRGLGFAVGQEPLAALFANLGCTIVATDLDPGRPESKLWEDRGQYASQLADLNRGNVCAADVFRQRVSFAHVDMNQIPADLRGFDFCWSSCALEHLGSLHLGAQFLINMTRCLKPRGVGVHTTEFNVSSNEETMEYCDPLDPDQDTVLFRRRDIEDLAAVLRQQGHRLELDFNVGDGEADHYVDPEPFTNPNPHMHLKLKTYEFAATSIGLIVEVGRQRFMDRLRRRLARWLG